MRMSRFFVLGVLASGALLSGRFLFPAKATAQDFHVETTLYAIGRGEPRELMQSVTQFHANKTYDFIPQMGELIVFDPAHGQFTLVNTRQKRMAEVHLDEINRMLGIARRALNDHVQVLQAETKPNESAIEQILFQFNPTFEKSVIQTTAGPEIQLKSKFFTYQVLGAAADPNARLCLSELRGLDLPAELRSAAGRHPARHAAGPRLGVTRREAGPGRRQFHDRRRRVADDSSHAPHLLGAEPPRPGPRAAVGRLAFAPRAQEGQLSGLPAIALAEPNVPAPLSRGAACLTHAFL